MKHLKIRIFKFSGGGPPDPPNRAALLTCIFIFPASRRGHHAGRVCHLSLDFMSQLLHRLGPWSLAPTTALDAFQRILYKKWSNIYAMGYQSQHIKNILVQHVIKLMDH